jgi:hypothetical protein
VVENARSGPNININKTMESRSSKPVTKRLDLRLSATGLDSRVSWQDLKDWAREAGDVTFTNVFVKDGQTVGVIEYAVRCCCFFANS